jgi:hypothetical protein
MPSRKAAALLFASLIFGIPQIAMPISILGTADPAGLARSIVDGTSVTYVEGSATYYGLGGEFQSATFTGGGTDIGFDSGIVLSNGDATSIPGGTLGDNPKIKEVLKQQLPRGDFWSTVWDYSPAAGFDDLANLVGASEIYDPNLLQFSFSLEPGTWNLNFNYVFASEEYINFVGSDFNDAFGFFIDGTNVGTLADGTVVSVNSINPDTNAQSYRNNVPGYFSADDYFTKDPTIPSLNLNVEPDGLTTVLVTQSIVLGEGIHTARLVIGDVADPTLDSAILIQGGSFSATPAVPEPTTLLLLGTGLLGIAPLRYRLLGQKRIPALCVTRIKKLLHR